MMTLLATKTPNSYKFREWSTSVVIFLVAENFLPNLKTFLFSSNIVVLQTKRRRVSSDWITP